LDEFPLWLKAAEPRKPQVTITRRTKKSERLVPRDMKNPRPLSLGSDCGKTEKLWPV
jgi:hypothetical protein